MNHSLHEAPTTSDLLTLLSLSAVWGASFLFLRITSPVFGPFFLIEMRVLSAFVVLLPISIYLGKWSDVRNNWGRILLISIANMGLPFCLLAFATLSIGAGMASILNAAVPFFTAIVGYVLYRQALTYIGILGLFVGFAGVSVLALDPGNNTGTDSNLLAIAAGLLAAFCYGVAANMTSHYFRGVSGLAITVGSLFFASLYLAPFAILQRPEVMPTGSIWLSVISLGVFCTGLAYVLFYRLIANIGSSRAVTVTFLVPPFSILWGFVFLGEHLTLFMLLGCLLVLVGVSMTTGKVPTLGWFRAR